MGDEFMPRAARKKSETGIYHIILRGINRQVIFEENEDYIRFLQTLKKYKSNGEFIIYAYCLMDNHVHLLIKEGNEELALIMRRIGASYVYWYNDKYDRVGHLFQDRFKSETIENDRYLLAVLRYIHHNPVKAGIVGHMQDYKWSSYNEYLNIDHIIDSDFILSLFSHNKEIALSSLKEFHEINDDEFYLDIDKIKRANDNEARKIIKKLCNIEKCTDLQNMDDKQRDRYIKALKQTGLSTRQLERLTGINRNKILKA